MALKIVTADQRIQSATVKGQIWGQAGVGKTTLLKTLDPATTLCLDFEAGMLSVQKADERGPAWGGDSVRVENWPEAKAILEAFKTGAPFLAKYRTVFIDSTTNASTMCFEWCQTQPDAFSEKTGKPDTRGAYGLLAREMCAWVQDWKNLDALNVWLVGGLERKEVDGVKDWMPLVMGAKLANALPYIMDTVFVMARFKADDGKVYAGIFTDPYSNPEYASVPLKSRVSGLAPIEQPHLGKLMAKALGFPPAVSAPPPSSIGPALDGEASATPNHSEAA